jgi:hypothetical protein
MKASTLISMAAVDRIAVTVALATALSSAVAQAAPVTDWRTYKATTATTLAGQGTDDPIVGDLLGNTATPSFVIGYLASPAVLGANVGDKVTFTFGVAFNDATGMSNNGDNFRFALFDLNGEAQDSATGGAGSGPNYAAAGTDNTDDYRGYVFGHRGGAGAGAGGSIRERISALVTGDNAFAATGDNSPTAPSLGAVGGDPIPLVSDVNGNGAGTDYTGELTLTRTAAGVDLSGKFIGSNPTNLGNIYEASDNTPPSSSTFGAVGFLIGNALSVDEVTFTDVDVAVIPAGATLDADFDGDGDIDGDDFLTWQRGVGGSNVTNADGNADGDADVDGDDLAVWKTQFGATPATASVGAVPEPASLALLAAGAGALLFRRRESAA